MKILVDADACPVKNEIIEVAKKYLLEVHMFIDVNHRLDGYEAVIHTVDQGADSVDLALINSMSIGDVVISQDYGVATLALARKGYVMLPSGRHIHDGNIDQLLFERHIGRETRKQKMRGERHKKRTPLDNENFQRQFEQLIVGILQ